MVCPYLILVVSYTCANTWWEWCIRLYINQLRHVTTSLKKTIGWFLCKTTHSDKFLPMKKKESLPMQALYWDQNSHRGFPSDVYLMSPNKPHPLDTELQGSLVMEPYSVIPDSHGLCNQIEAAWFRSVPKLSVWQFPTKIQHLESENSVAVSLLRLNS